MTIEVRIEEIREIVDEANGLSKKGENEEALQLLREAWDEANFLSESKTKLLKGLICHYEGRVLQAMGKYKDAVESLQYAAGFRKDDLIQLAYTWFQLFICKEYGNIPISGEEVEETKMALIAAMANDAATIKDIGNMLQNVAYVEQVKGDIKKAILFYKMTLDARRTAHDERGVAFDGSEIGRSALGNRRDRYKIKCDNLRRESIRLL